MSLVTPGERSFSACLAARMTRLPWQSIVRIGAAILADRKGEVSRRKAAGMTSI